MTHAEISEIITRHTGELALALAVIEKCHADIKRFQRLHARYSRLPALTPYQRTALQRAAIDSAGGRRFLDSGWAVRWAVGC